LTARAGTYVVQRGDTLYSIALRYGTTVAALKQINRLTGDLIYVGQVLFIGAVPTVSVTPVGTPGSTTHTVVRGDTLYSIARRYGTTVNAIVAANHLVGVGIYVGQRLLISVPSTATPLPGQASYTVAAGDTLYSIAQRYGTSVEAIVAANHLPNTLIYVGQRLVIPGGRTATPTPITTGTVTVTPTPTPTPTPTRTPTLTPTP
jgi:LysM repeat protein